ncbi:hypothetical protein FRC01_005292 [Tulasnella sp. 417]|nr:hypothetical protein FRC01_005292 [Tulasnella sp. 417]
MDQACGETEPVLREGSLRPVGSNSDILKPLPSNVAITNDDSGHDRGLLGMDTNAVPFAPIQHLPFELLSTLFKLCIGDNTPVRDLISLTLVCKLWRSIVEDTPSLWCCISGWETAPRVRKGLAMAKDTPLKIMYREDVAETDPETFFGEIGGRITQWKSLNITTGRSDLPMTVLQTTTPPNLETLEVNVSWGQEWNGGLVTLFRGEPAPLTLKRLYVHQIPVVVEPLRLSGLRSLGLSRMPVVSAEEILRVLRESPALERCYLYYLNGLENFGLPGQEQELSRLQRVETPNIHLAHLRSLGLGGLPVSFVHLVLSVIQVPNLQWIAVDCKIDQHAQSPKSELFTTRISHHSPTLTTLIKTAQNMELVSFSEANWKISVGSLLITLEGLAFKLKHLDETLEWLFSHPGGHLKTLPVSLSLHESEINTSSFTQLTSPLKVTKLDLWTASSFEHVPDSQPRNIISLLSQPLESTPTQWVLPNLEYLSTNVVNEDGKSRILEMVKARHTFIGLQLERTPDGGDIPLKPLKEIRLRGGRNGISRDPVSNTHFLIALQNAARGAEIWWEEVKWTGSEDWKAAMTSN